MIDLTARELGHVRVALRLFSHALHEQLAETPKLDPSRLSLLENTREVDGLLNRLERIN